VNPLFPVVSPRCFRRVSWWHRFEQCVLPGAFFLLVTNHIRQARHFFHMASGSSFNRRRSCTDRPPQTPNGSAASMAYSRHHIRTEHPSHIFRAGLESLPLPKWKMSQRPTHAPESCHPWLNRTRRVYPQPVHVSTPGVIERISSSHCGHRSSRPLMLGALTRAPLVAVLPRCLTS
jgi:hypothetical protein